MSPFPHLVAAEVRHAGELHPPLANHDEALEVLLEEVFEVQSEVYKKRSERADGDLLTELVQVAAMARRWVECCDLEAVLLNRFDDATPLVLLSLRRLQKKANGDHESLTRLKRLTHKIAAMCYEGGPELGRHLYDVGLALLAVAATCQRWAEDRGLVPFDPRTPPEIPAVEAATVPPPPPAPAPAETPHAPA